MTRAFATQVQLNENGEWVGLDGPLHPEDGPTLNQVHRQVFDDLLARINDLPLPRPQTHGDMPEAKAQLRAIRAIEALRDSFKTEGA